MNMSSEAAQRAEEAAPSMPDALPQTDSRERLAGIALLVLAVALFAVVDGLSKILADTQSIGQIVWARYALGLPVLVATTPRAAWRTLLATRRPWGQVLRGIAPLTIGASMVMAVHHLPLAEATVILFAGPFLVVALSGPLLGERAAPASWVGVALGFVAVLIVARPGLGVLSGYTVFPAVGAVFYALFQLLTRRLAAQGENSVTTLAWTLLVGTVASTPFAFFTWQELDLRTGALMLALGLVFGLAQALMIRAFAKAPAGLLTPFSYAQIIAATLFGIVVFGAVPDAWTFLGIALIIAAGIVVVRNRGG